MATVFLLIRHGSNDAIGKSLAGRAPGVRLNAQGLREAEQLVVRLERVAVSALYVSPLERAMQTAAPLAARLRLTPQIDPALHEVDFGAWTGKAFDELAADPHWAVWVDRRSEARPPGGESIVEVQRRIVSGLDRLRTTHTGETVALISHGDVIKSTLAFFLGLSLDRLERFEIAPASVSVLVAGDGWAQVKSMNETGSSALS